MNEPTARPEAQGASRLSVLLLECEDSNPTGDEWRWEAWVTRRKDGRFSCSLHQYALGASRGGLHRPKGLIGFRSGKKLYEFLCWAWEENTGNPLAPDELEQAGKRLSSLDEKLARDMATALSDDLNPPPPLTVPEMHARKATWEPRVWNGGGGLVQAFESSLRYRAAAFYASKYYAQHGSLPVGTHRVNVTVGPAGSGADILPPLGTSRRTLDVDITYPNA